MRDPAGVWTCGSTFLRVDADVHAAWLGMALGYFGEDVSADSDLPASIAGYEPEYAMSRVLGEAVIPPPLIDALQRMEIGGLSLVVAGNVSGMLPIPALALPGSADVRLVERAVIRVQPPAFLAELVGERDCDPFGPWPLSIACLDPVGDLPHARHGDLGCEHRLTAGKLVAEGAQRSVPASRRALRNALQSVGRGANAVFFYSGHVNPGEAGGDLSAHLVLDDGDIMTAGEFFGLGPEPAACVPTRVILSACDSGGTTGSGSGEWFGLGAAFLVAGARQVVATAWPIPDSVFAATFERTVLMATQDALDVGRALRDVQVDALRQWRAQAYEDPERAGIALPRLWGAYQAIGLLT